MILQSPRKGQVHYSTVHIEGVAGVKAPGMLCLAFGRGRGVFGQERVSKREIREKR
jgi:hypothetical protein